ncbi:MAG TPA: hypothetical protein VM599_10235 [Thermoanaerobaculia bacterium]|nr:hypothetical protein [Thermoanaerobaculia bacterium]
MTSARRTPTDAEALAAVLAERAAEEEAAWLGEEPGGGAGGGEPGEEELLDYLEGRLAPEAEAELQRRLVASPEVARKLLDLADLVEAGSAARAEARAQTGRGRAMDEPADLAVHAAWRGFQGRLPERPARPGRANRGLLALAATLLVAVVGLGSRVWQLETGARTEADLMVANLETLELFEGVRSDRVPTVELDPDEPLHLVLAPAERCPSYRAELTRSTGSGPADRRTVTGLERDDRGLVSFLFRGEPGRFALRLLGCEPEHEISTYDFEIVRPGIVTQGENAS